MSDNAQYTKLHVIAFGLAVGLTWSISLFVMATVATMFNVGLPFIHLLQNFYGGYHGDLIGGLTGAMVAFIDLFIAASIIACIYNCIVCCSCKKKEGE